MRMIQAQGGGGLFSDLLPKVLGVAGTAIGGPVGGAIGQTVGGIASGQDVGSAIANGAMSGFSGMQHEKDLAKIGKAAGEAAKPNILGNFLWPWAKDFLADSLAGKALGISKNDDTSDYGAMVDDAFRQRNGWGNGGFRPGTWL